MSWWSLRKAFCLEWHIGHCIFQNEKLFFIFLTTLQVYRDVVANVTTCSYILQPGMQCCHMQRVVWWRHWQIFFIVVWFMTSCILLPKGLHSMFFAFPNINFVISKNKLIFGLISHVVSYLWMFIIDVYLTHWSVMDDPITLLLSS